MIAMHKYKLEWFNYIQSTLKCDLINYKYNKIKFDHIGTV